MTAAVLGVLGGGGGVPTYLAETTAWATACTTPPTTPRKNTVDTLIRGLMSDGIWPELDWLLLCAAETEQAARVNVANPAKVASNVNSCTFTTDRGFTGDGISMHIALGEALSSAGNWSQDSAAFGVWCNLDTGGTAARYETGTNGGGRAFVQSRSTGGNETFEINDSTASVLQGNTGSRLGHRAASRQGPTDKRGYFNGALVATVALASTATSSSLHYLLRSAAVYSAHRVGAFWSASGLTDTEMAAMHDRLNTYLTAVGGA